MTEHENMIITKYDLYFESRLSKLEADTSTMKLDLKDIKNDLRWIIGMTLAGYGSLFALMAHGFKWF